MKRTWRNVLYSAYEHAAIRIEMVFSTLRSRLLLGWQGCLPGPSFRTSGRCWFKARRAGSIVIGPRVTLLSSHRSNRVGLSQPIMLETMGEGVIEIGEGSGGSGLVISARSRVTIGRGVKLGGNVRIYDHDFHSLDSSVRNSSKDRNSVTSRPVVIGDRAFIGANAIILKGAEIGEEAVVGAGAVVASSVPPRETWAGNPARPIRKANP